jgi:hypothetical protein
VPQTSIKHRAESREALVDAPDAPGGPIQRARRRIRAGYYDRPEVRRTLATLILHRAAQRTLLPR